MGSTSHTHASASHCALPGESSFVFTLDWALASVKDMVHPYSCEWERCPAELNSWAAIQEHLHQHCQQQLLGAIPMFSQPQYSCKILRCAGRYHTSISELKDHVALSHMSRLQLPCPVQGCTTTIPPARVATVLPTHLQSEHGDLLNQLYPIWSPIFHPKRFPRRSSHQELPTLPQRPVPTFKMLCPEVRGTQRPATSTGSQNARRGRWKRMAKSVAPADDEADSESMPFADLVPSNYWTAGPELLPLEFHDWVACRREPSTVLQLSRPQPMIIPPVREPPPPRSIGFDAFAARFKNLERAGLIDGSGQWPTEDGEEG